MGRGSHQTMIGIKHYWYPCKNMDGASIFPSPRIHLTFAREDGFPKEGVNVVSVKVTRTVELTGYGVQE